MKKKKRLKLHKKNFMILCFTIIVLIGSITLLTRMVVKEISHKNKPQKTLSTKEIKLEKLNNIDKKVNYFNYNYLDRYINYKKKNNNLSDKQIVLNVNMNLDYKFYEKTIPSKYLNKEYILVNKYYYVGEKYVPENLESLPLSYSRSGMKLTNVAKSALEELINAAKTDNMTILVTSSYRSYEYQVKLYNQYAEENSKEEADTYSARPGYSEHQTGLAVDIHNGKKVYTDFENTEEFNWMQENAYKYGFILRFPKDKVNETGYIYESWHYRYVGKDIAKYIHKNNISFEEYYARFIENKK
ncbi:MAG: M15 family metallopeptidase [Clostridia bacterium]